MKRLLVTAIAICSLVLAVPSALADGTETLGNPSVAVADGTAVLAAGAGMENFPDTSKSFGVTVPAGATVKQVLLYWEGHFTADYGTPDATISVNGNSVTGTSIGGPTVFFTWPGGDFQGQETFQTYRKDITTLGLVVAGGNTLAISNMNFGTALSGQVSGNDGAGVLVVYSLPGTGGAIRIRDGLDLAFNGFASPLDTTVAQTFTFVASASPRTATISSLLGSVFNGDPTLGFRTNQLRVTFDLGGTGDVTLDNPWQSLEGIDFDASSIPVTVPAGATQMTLQALSGGPNGAPGANTPASFAWVGTAVTIPESGRAKVIKTEAGVPPAGTSEFTFQLRQGASTTQLGTILETQNANAGNGGVINFATVLVPGQHYQLCELVMPGWNTSLPGTLFVPGSIIPPTLPNPNVDNSPVCVDFIAQAEVTTTFTVDNTFPGGLARTIGFWKNWASCADSNGKQKPVLDQTLVLAEPTGIVVSATSGTYPAFGPVLYRVLHASDCQKAVRLLNKSRIDNGKKLASDPAFNLAAQLVAAELNFTAGAAKNGTVITAVNQAVLLLGKYAFNGSTHTTISKADATVMNNLAKTLDNYNNNRP